MDKLNVDKYNIHPVATLFNRELGEFLDDHFELEYKEYNEKYESTDDYMSFADHFYHGISWIYPDTRKLNPTNRSFDIYCGYWKQCEYVYKLRYGEEFINNLTKNI